MTQESKTFNVIKEHLKSRGIEEDQITAKARLSDDLGLDSLDTVELTVAMEERFGIEIPDSDLEHLGTIGDAVRLIDAKTSLSA
jgi:acyl carrier protein